MTSTGIIRRMDDFGFGRIVIPKEVRQNIFGKQDIAGMPFEIYYEADGTIILKPCSAEAEEDK